MTVCLQMGSSTDLDADIAQKAAVCSPCNCRSSNMTCERPVGDDVVALGRVDDGVSQLETGKQQQENVHPATIEVEVENRGQRHDTRSYLPVVYRIEKHDPWHSPFYIAIPYGMQVFLQSVIR